MNHTFLLRRELLVFAPSGPATANPTSKLIPRTAHRAFHTQSTLQQRLETRTLSTSQLGFRARPCRLSTHEPSWRGCVPSSRAQCVIACLLLYKSAICMQVAARYHSHTGTQENTGHPFFMEISDSAALPSVKEFGRSEHESEAQKGRRISLSAACSLDVSDGVVRGKQYLIILHTRYPQVCPHKQDP